ncbi:hypothetical protein FIBSPDRAFT_1050594 [Athelia psychrophila]|uniref:Uncharacterized protein n=1 Tax=Athelia psychrophila TaxID=1759441 RepID=A0A166AJJ6_9AGAM|nr:hypothetical protein FIBSPDRAFT_1050594 [Fibularhizoctonia sp. CBS 109695]
MADTIDPRPLSDHMNPLTETIVTSALIVTGRLDTELLRVAFATLVEKWPKLGTRIVKGKNGLFEFHTPLAFSDERPPFIYTIAHKIDSQCPDIPKRALGSQANLLTYQHLFRSKDCPALMSEWIKQKDAPVIRLHFTTFSDVTCIGFTLPHLFADVPGISVILRAWCSIVAGHESQLPALLTEDPIANIGGPYPSTKKELKTFHADMEGGYRLFSFWNKIRYYVPMTAEFVRHPKEEVRLVFLPLQTLEKMRRSAMAELKDEKEVWVSENDIVYALIIKLSNLHRNKNDKTPYAMAMTANFRAMLPELKDPSKAFLHNCITYFACPVIPSGSMPDSSVGDLARHIRAAIVAQRPLAQSEKVMTVYREMCRRGDYPSYCPPNGRQFTSTSWLAGRWPELDFSPAVIDTESADAGSTEKFKGGALGDPGKVIFSGGSSNLPKMPRRLWAIIMSRQPDDAAGEGGVWFEMAARTELWPKIDEYLQSL